MEDLGLICVWTYLSGQCFLQHLEAWRGVIVHLSSILFGDTMVLIIE